MTSQPSVQAVVFDMDGLMIDSEPLAYWAWDQVLGRYGFGMDDALFREILGMRVIDCAQLLCQRAGWIETDSGIGLRCSSRLEESIGSQTIHMARLYSLNIL